jgi:uncharacterized membrane protein YgdD (TMEM256/DUF423 family)
MIWAKLGSLFMFLGVALGAFGSHALRGRVSDYALEVYKTAVLYQMVHALGLFIVAWVVTTTANPKANWAGIFLLLGIIIFSGSLYLLSLTGMKWLGAITPIGGLSFLAGWILLLVSLLSLQ